MTARRQFIPKEYKASASDNQSRFTLIKNGGSTYMLSRPFYIFIILWYDTEIIFILSKTLSHRYTRYSRYQTVLLKLEEIRSLFFGGILV